MVRRWLQRPEFKSHLGHRVNLLSIGPMLRPEVAKFSGTDLGKDGKERRRDEGKDYGFKARG